MSIIPGNGSYKLRNSENGADRVGEVKNDNPVLFCHGSVGSARHVPPRGGGMRAKMSAR